MVFGTLNRTNNFKITFQDSKSLQNVGNRTTVDTNCQGCACTPDGKQIFTMSTSDYRLRRHVLSTAWDVSSAVDTTVFKSLPLPYTDVTTENGIEWYFPQSTTMYMYRATTAWDVSSLPSTATESLSVSGVISDASGCFITGNFLYVSGTIATIALYDIKNGLTNAVLIDTFTTPNRSHGLCSSPDGSTIFYVNPVNDRIYEISVPQGFKGFTGASVQTKNLNTLGVLGSGNPRGITIERITGNRIIITDATSDSFYSGKLTL